MNDTSEKKSNSEQEVFPRVAFQQRLLGSQGLGDMMFAHKHIPLEEVSDTQKESWERRLGRYMVVNRETLQMIRNRCRTYPVGNREPLRILDREVVQLT